MNLLGWQTVSGWEGIRAREGGLLSGMTGHLGCQNVLLAYGALILHPLRKDVCRDSCSLQGSQGLLNLLTKT